MEIDVGYGWGVRRGRQVIVLSRWADGTERGGGDRKKVGYPRGSLGRSGRLWLQSIRVGKRGAWKLEGCLRPRVQKADFIFGSRLIE